MDFDGNGMQDIVSGSYHPGDLFLFRKQEDGTYAKSEKILDKDGKPVNVGPASTAYFVDWDGDGDLDVVVGNIQGEVWLVLNEGSRQEPAYGTKEALTADGKRIVVAGGDAGPIVVDWDGDGKLDLIVGAGDGSVLLYRNTSDDRAQPKLAAARALVPPSTVMNRMGPGGAAADAEHALKHGMRAKAHVADWNGDGKLDLLVGDFSYSDTPPELTDEQKRQQEQAEAKLRELTAEQQRLALAPDGETPDQRKQRQKELRDVQRQIIEHSRTAMAAAQPRRMQQHGYVWLFLRKDIDKTAGAQGAGG